HRHHGPLRYAALTLQPKLPVRARIEAKLCPRSGSLSHLSPLNRDKVIMKILTLTEAKRNLSQCLDAAARGEDIGIIRGADIIALRPISVESTDYAHRECGATPKQIAALEQVVDRRYGQLKRSDKLLTVGGDQLRKLIG